jgi:hypothetical protein
MLCWPCPMHGTCARKQARDGTMRLQLRGRVFMAGAMGSMAGVSEHCIAVQDTCASCKQTSARGMWSVQ